MLYLYTYGICWKTFIKCWPARPVCFLVCFFPFVEEKKGFVKSGRPACPVCELFFIKYFFFKWWYSLDLAWKDLRREHKGSRVTSVISRSHSLPSMGIISANVILAISILITIVWHKKWHKLCSLGKPRLTKIDKFLERFQTALDPHPPSDSIFGGKIYFICFGKLRLFLLIYTIYWLYRLTQFPALTNTILWTHSEQTLGTLWAHNTCSKQYYIITAT